MTDSISTSIEPFRTDWARAEQAAAAAGSES